MSRNVAGLIHRVSIGYKMMVDDDDERFFLAQRQLKDSSMVYFLSIINIARDTDEGVYSVIRRQDSLAEIKRGSVTVLFKYFPTDIYPRPICYPSDYDHFTLQLTFITSMDDDGAIYVCRITSVTFPDELCHCHVGPFKMLPDPKTTLTPSSANTSNTNNKVTPGEITVVPKDGKGSNGPDANGPHYITSECSEVCDEHILYWIIATIITGNLAIVFCIVGIIILVRYRRRLKEEHKKERWNQMVWRWR